MEAKVLYKLPRLSVDVDFFSSCWISRSTSRPQSGWERFEL